MLRVGVAGTGFGAQVHARAFAALPEVAVVGIAAATPESAARAAKELGIPHASDSVAALLDLDLDVVSLALPPTDNAAAAAVALRNGIPVLSEKPLADSLAAAADLEMMARGHLTAVDFQFAELEVFRRAKRLLEEGALGAVRHVDVQWHTESYAQRARQWSWKTDSSRGGGVVPLLASHVLYLAEWLLGPSSRLAARGDCRATSGFAPPGTAPAPDSLWLTMEHGPVVLAATISNASPGMSLHRWHLACERGALVLENQGRDYMGGFRLTLLSRDGAIVETLCEPPTGGDGRLPPFMRLAERFVTSVREGLDFHPGFAEGLRVQWLMDRIHLSSDSQAWVSAS